MQHRCAAVGVFVVSTVFGAAAQQPAQRSASKAATAGPAAVGKTQDAGAGSGPVQRAAAGLWAGARASAFTTIQGNALTATNAALPDATVRLRDVRIGRIAGVSTTDKAGLFSFHGVDPGSYVVELVGDDHTILAASQILYVDAGQTVSTLVKLPFRSPPLFGIFGHTVASAAAVAAAAAASGVLATAVTGAEASANGKPIIR
jgi:hypothetical protein